MRLLAVALILPFALATPIATGAVPEATLAPLSTNGEHIEDAYIVVFKKGVDLNQIALHLTDVEEWHGADPLYTFSSDGELETGGINHVYAPTSASFGYYGYAGKFSPSTLESIRASPDVDFVEHDQIVHTMDVPQGVDEPLVDSDHDAYAPSTPPGITTELNAPWGLARISHRDTLHLSTFTKYVYNADGGDGVTAYVIDTGINVDHVEFEGRAVWGKTIPKNDVDKDGNGHGTHCAGTIASRKYGVAKAATVVAVKVLGSNGSGSMSDVVAGVVWAAEQAAAAAVAAEKELAATGKTKHKGSVANMSLGGGKAKSLDIAVNEAVNAGLHFAVAAGNDNKDACNYSPAAAELAVTVGASTLGDERAYFSNHGKCVDVFAPGLNILSTWNGGNETSNTISGTSMASPHICGLLAYLLSIHGTETFDIRDASEQVVDSASLYARAYSLLPRLAQAVLPTPEQMPLVVSPTGDDFAPIPKNATLTPAKLKKALIALASPGILTDLPSGTPNLLAFNNATLPSKRK
ncbi:peptidase S8/S53 domain-containing protein [Naematelia encephala]|uniref:Peptidase S8/S53 domain-containing protein n=1 Tax=Naematelia encephala TaxID=71784 RepID=A0A1Y2B867_9TREE|nr:peptidase S8/S53 domain-containing protein [Naematelia encephala]